MGKELFFLVPLLCAVVPCGIFHWLQYYCLMDCPPPKKNFVFYVHGLVLIMTWDFCIILGACLYLVQHSSKSCLVSELWQCCELPTIRVMKLHPFPCGAHIIEVKVKYERFKDTQGTWHHRIPLASVLRPSKAKGICRSYLYFAIFPKDMPK